MKKLLLSTFLLLSNLACAQGNLQFNQVLLLSTSQNTTVLLGTVPAGKTWKIEGFGTELQGNNECNFSFNGSNVAFRSGSAFIYSGSYAYVGSTDHFGYPQAPLCMLLLAIILMDTDGLVLLNLISYHEVSYMSYFFFPKF